MKQEGTRKEAAENTRRKILAVSTNLFMEKGYEQVATREIAQACQITQPNLYHHFTNKKEIYLAVLTSLTDKVARALKQVLLENDPLKEKLKKMIMVLLENHPTNLFSMLKDISKLTDKEEWEEMYRLFHKTYIQSFIHAFEGEKLRTGVVKEEAARFILYNVSALFDVQSTYNKKNDFAYIDQMIDFILYGVC